MAEISAAELRRLKALEARIASTRDDLSTVRARRDQFRAEAVAARRELRATTRDRDKLEKQIDQLVEANAAMADELEQANKDLGVVGGDAAELRKANDALRSQLEAAKAELAEAAKRIKASDQDRARLKKQLGNATDQLEGKQPPELTPDQLSHLLGRFIDQVGAQTGLRLSGTRLNLKVGFTGRGGARSSCPPPTWTPRNCPACRISCSTSPRGPGARRIARR